MLYYRYIRIVYMYLLYENVALSTVYYGFYRLYTLLLLPILSLRSRTYSHTAIKHNFRVFVCQLKTIKM